MSSLGIFAEIHPEFARVLAEQRKPMPYLLNQRGMASFPDVIELNKFFARDDRFRRPENMVAYLWHDTLQWWVLYQRRPEAEGKGPAGYLNFYPVLPLDQVPPQFMPADYGGVKSPRPMTIEDYFTFVRRGSDMDSREKDRMLEEADDDPFAGADVVTAEMAADHAASKGLDDDAEALAENLTSEMHDARASVNPNLSRIVIGPGTKSAAAPTSKVVVEDGIVYTTGDTPLDSALRQRPSVSVRPVSKGGRPRK